MIRDFLEKLEFRLLGSFYCFFKGHDWEFLSQYDAGDKFGIELGCCECGKVVGYEYYD